jgi:beta-lactamase regulating signal transducer with metallopeptidase domain/protein involved in polysaccharide export with SLBB domain
MPHERQSIDWPRLALVAWLSGAAGIMALGAWRYAHVARAAPRGARPHRAAWRREWRRQVHTAGVRRRVALRLTENLGPLLCYVPPRYLVLVPRALWSTLAAPQRQAILRHELAHLSRGDLWASLAIRALALPQWFNPFVWLAVRRFDEAGEWACDDAAARATGDGGLTLARSLLQAAEFTCQSSPGAVAAQGGVLSRRIRRLVAPQFKEESKMKKCAVLGMLAALATVQLVRIERVAAEETDDAGESAAVAEESSPIEDQWTPTEAEKAAMSARLPTYVIEPPDVLSIQFSGKAEPVGIGGEFIKRGRVTTKRRKHLVTMDGKINLDMFGTVYVAGMTIDQARSAIEQQLEQSLDDVIANVDVSASNSKVCYIITQSGGGGDDVVRLPVTGNETVLDAIAAVDAELKGAPTQMWIARPAAHGVGNEQILRINWSAISRGASTATNYLLLPGDRLFVQLPVSAKPRRDAIPAVPAQPPSPVIERPGVAPAGYQLQPAAAAARADDDVVSLHLKLADGKEFDQRLPRADGMTVGGLISGATYPNPLLDFGAAHITLSRPEGPPQLGGASELPVVWDRTLQRPTVDSDYKLEAGDRVRLDFTLPPLARPTDPAPAALPVDVSGAAPVPTPAIPLEFQISFIEDRSGDLADFDGLRRTGMVTIGDRSTISAALRVFRKHGLIKTLADPTIRTQSGRPASFHIGVPADDAGNRGPDFRVSKKVTVLAHAQPDRPARSLSVKLFARAENQQIDISLPVNEGQTAIVKLAPTPNSNDDDVPVYVAVTPRWLD